MSSVSFYGASLQIVSDHVYAHPFTIFISCDGTFPSFPFCFSLMTVISIFLSYFSFSFIPFLKSRFYACSPYLSFSFLFFTFCPSFIFCFSFPSFILFFLFFLRLGLRNRQLLKVCEGYPFLLKVLLWFTLWSCRIPSRWHLGLLALRSPIFSSLFFSSVLSFHAQSIFIRLIFKRFPERRSSFSSLSLWPLTARFITIRFCTFCQFSYTSPFSSTCHLCLTHQWWHCYRDTFLDLCRAFIEHLTSWIETIHHDYRLWSGPRSFCSISLPS